MPESGELSDSSPPARNQTPSKRSLRGRSGCLNCRRRRKKCDEHKPSCAKCKRLGEECEWDSGLTFRHSSIDVGHPSMRAASNATSLLHNFQLVDVTFDNETHQRKEFLNGKELIAIDAAAEDDAEAMDEREDGSFKWDLGSSKHEPMDTSPNVPPTFSIYPDAGASDSISQHTASPELQRRSISQAAGAGTVDRSGSISGTRLSSTQESYQAPASKTSFSASPMDVPAGPIVHNAEQEPILFGIPELGPLDYLTDQDAAFQRGFGDSLWPPLLSPGTESVVGIDHVMADSPDMYAMYYPNATYRELHTTLYNHMVETAKGIDVTRQGTPESDEPQIAAVTHPLTWQSAQKSGTAFAEPPKGMTIMREMELWRNYLDEIALWLDMFDNERHFQYRLPVLAQTSEHLRFSVLALSARQMERRDPNKPYTESLGLYQEAIRLIAQDLETMDTAVIASCVLLCVLEMMSSSPRDWGRHLDGCAMLIKAAGINGVVGGMKQAVFWCFARMDMWGGFLSDTNTKIPTSLWFLPTGSMSAAITRFKTDFQNFDSYANYSLFLCASVLNVVSSKEGAKVPKDRMATYSTRWKALFDLLEDWHVNRPTEMRPLYSSASDSPSDGPFPVILYSNATAISGNQLYHTAALLMLQAKPKEVRLRGQKSIFWHARQICGITASNLSHAAYTNALQPLWFAGKVMSSKTEHEVVLKLLDRIERETGFATAWRAQDLKDYWGD